MPFASRLYQFFYKRLRPSGIIMIQVVGHQIFINAADTGIAPWLLTGREFAPDEAMVLRRLLKPGMVFADVGANIGYFSLIAARAVGGGGKVFAFEPDEENFSLLQRNIRDNGYKNVVAIKKAVSDKTGRARLYFEQENLCAHSLVPKTGQNFQEVETVSLDDFFRGQKVDVIKIDVEGTEPAVLVGMQKLIEANPELVLLTEFYPAALRRFGVLPEQYLRDLKSVGFLLYQLGQNGALQAILNTQIPALARGEGISKLANLVCVHGSFS